MKEKYLARVAEHRERDELVHGTYWSLGKGSAVGGVAPSRLRTTRTRGTRSSSASLCGRIPVKTDFSSQWTTERLGSF